MGIVCNICGKKVGDNMSDPWHLHLFEHFGSPIKRTKGGRLVPNREVIMNQAKFFTMLSLLRFLADSGVPIEKIPAEKLKEFMEGVEKVWG